MTKLETHSINSDGQIMQNHTQQVSHQFSIILKANRIYAKYAMPCRHWQFLLVSLSKLRCTYSFRQQRFIELECGGECVVALFLGASDGFQ